MGLTRAEDWAVRRASITALTVGVRVCVSS
jgi:hypothetical protein